MIECTSLHSWISFFSWISILRRKICARFCLCPLNKWTNTTGSSNCFRVKIITDLKSKFKGLQNEPPYDYITDRPNTRSICNRNRNFKNRARKFNSGFIITFVWRWSRPPLIFDLVLLMSFSVMILWVFNIEGLIVVEITILTLVLFKHCLYAFFNMM